MVSKIYLIFVLLCAICYSVEPVFKGSPVINLDSLRNASLSRINMDSATKGLPDIKCFYIDSGSVIYHDTSKDTLSQKIVGIGIGRLARSIAYKVELDSVRKIDSLVWLSTSYYKSDVDNCFAYDKTILDSVLTRSNALTQSIQQNKFKPVKTFFIGGGCGIVVSALIAIILAVKGII